MAIVNLDLYSYELAMNTQVAVLLPERRGVPHASRAGRPYPVVYLLHGHGQDHTSWLRLSRLESYLQNTDVIVVMPNGSRGCYVDGTATHRYGTYLTDELPVALSNWFHLSSARENTSAGVPLMRMWPDLSTKIRSAFWAISSMLWLTSKMVRFLLRW